MRAKTTSSEWLASLDLTAQNEAIESIKDGLRQRADLHRRHGARLHGWEEFLLEHGKPFYMDANTFKGRRRAAKQCYRNSFVESNDLSLTLCRRLLCRAVGYRTRLVHH